MFSKEQFSGVKHNPFACRKGEYLWEKYTELARIEAFTTIPEIEDRTANFPQPELSDLHILLCFIVLMVERHGNPLADIRGYDERAEYVWELLEVKKGNKLREFVSKPGKGNTWFSILMFMYFRLLNDKKYEAWFSQTMLLNTYNAILRGTPTKGDEEAFVKKAKIIRADISDLTADIEKLEANLFADERIRKIIQKEAVVESKRYPEMYAEEFVEQTARK